MIVTTGLRAFIAWNVIHKSQAPEKLLKGTIYLSVLEQKCTRKNENQTGRTTHADQVGATSSIIRYRFHANTTKQNHSDRRICT